MFYQKIVLSFYHCLASLEGHSYLSVVSCDKQSEYQFDRWFCNRSFRIYHDLKRGFSTVACVITKGQLLVYRVGFFFWIPRISGWGNMITNEHNIIIATHSSNMFHHSPMAIKNQNITTCIFSNTRFRWFLAV